MNKSTCCAILLICICLLGACVGADTIPAQHAAIQQEQEPVVAGEEAGKARTMVQTGPVPCRVEPIPVRQVHGGEAYSTFLYDADGSRLLFSSTVVDNWDWGVSPTSFLYLYDYERERVVWERDFTEKRTAVACANMGERELLYCSTEDRYFSGAFQIYSVDLDKGEETLVAEFQCEMSAIPNIMYIDGAFYILHNDTEGQRNVILEKREGENTPVVYEMDSGKIGILDALADGSAILFRESYKGQDYYCLHLCQSEKKLRVTMKHEPNGYALAGNGFWALERDAEILDEHQYLVYVDMETESISRVQPPYILSNLEGDGYGVLANESEGLHYLYAREGQLYDRPLQGIADYDAFSRYTAIGVGAYIGSMSDDSANFYKISIEME